MNIAESLKNLTKFEKCLWFASVSVITFSFIISGSGDALSLIASLVGVTSLIFLARGFAFGNILMIIFSILYLQSTTLESRLRIKEKMLAIVTSFPC